MTTWKYLSHHHLRITHEGYDRNFVSYLSCYDRRAFSFRNNDDWTGADMELTDSILATLIGVAAASVVAMLGMQLKIWIRLQRVPADLDQLAERVDVVERMVFQGFTGRAGT